MTSEVKTRSADFMESQNENESLQSRIREIEDENQELRTQNLLQNRTIIELRNELMLLRIQINELADTNVFLRERIRTLQDGQHLRENEGGSGPIAVPPLLGSPPVPPPLPSARIRISPRQVGAGEAITTPLGISLTSPSHHRIKKDCRQGIYRATRNPYRRLDNSEPGPSFQSPFFSSERPNYFLGLKIIPQFQSFVCSSSQLSNYDSASDSSGSDETPQLLKKPKPKSSEQKPTLKKPVSFSRDLEFLKNARNLHSQKLRQSILQNYNLSLPKSSSNFFFPLPWERKGRENIMPSTSGNNDTFFYGTNLETSERIQGENSGLRNYTKVSDCVQYTFPTIHEGLHHHGVNPVVSNGGQPSRVKRLKKNITCSSSIGEKDSEGKREQENGTEAVFENDGNQKNTALKKTTSGIDSESLSSFDDTRRTRRTRVREPPMDFEQDGFQADESSNCLTSTDNSLENFSLSEFNVEKKN